MFEDNTDDWDYDAKDDNNLASFDKMYKNNDYQYLDSDKVLEILEYLMLSNQLHKAMWAVDKALEHFPTNADLVIQKAEILAIQGELNQALLLLLQLEQIEPYNTELLGIIANCYSQLKNSDLAIKYYRKALNTVDIDDREVFVIGLTSELKKNDKFSEAISILKKEIDKYGSSEQLTYELAHSYEKLKDYETAAQCFIDYIDQDPYSDISWYNLGNTYAKSDQIDKTIWAYEYTILINEDFIPALYSIANAYFDANKTEKALEFYLRCLEIDEYDPIVYCAIGECYEELGEFEKAYEMYCESTELMPELGDAWLGRGIVSEILAFYTRSLNELQTAIDIDEFNSEYWKALGDVHENMGTIDKAVEAYEKAYHLNSTDEMAIVDYLGALSQLSVEEFDSAINQDLQLQQNPIVKLVFCYACWFHNEKSESILVFEEILQEDINLAKKLLEYFPEMEEDVVYKDLIKRYE